ncbi:MAG TPA: serine/threonine-protein kinase [Anaerolineales bacterium]|nr:serine/threonine-protein kinase [Anaerolineales bacterium]
MPNEQDSTTPKPDPRLPIPPGYKLIRPLGAGGMGLVYLAQRLADNQLVAIKFAKNHQIRLEREFRRLRQLDHPNIVRVFEHNEHALYPYFIMEHIEGETLDQLRRRQPDQRFALPRLAALFHQICAALEHIHAHQLIHRDLKPSNIMVVSAGGDLHVKVMDFGLVRPVSTDRKLTLLDAILGTPTYTPPEQFGSTPNLTFHADLYSVGVLLYEAATGQLPFEGDPDAFAQAAAGQISSLEAKKNHTTALQRQHIYQTPMSPRQLVSDVPPPLEQLIFHLLAKRPEDRPPSAAWVGEQLERLTVPSPPESICPECRRPNRPGAIYCRHCGSLIHGPLPGD